MAREPSPAYAFAVEALRSNPDASFEQLKARAHLENVSLHPIVYGLAKKHLGLAQPKPKRRKPELEPAPMPRPPQAHEHAPQPMTGWRNESAAPPRRAGGSGGAGAGSSGAGIDSVVGQLQHLVEEHARMREAMLRIKQIVDGLFAP